MALASTKTMSCISASRAAALLAITLSSFPGTATATLSSRDKGARRANAPTSGGKFRATSPLSKKISQEHCPRVVVNTGGAQLSAKANKQRKNMRKAKKNGGL